MLLIVFLLVLGLLVFYFLYRSFHKVRLNVYYNKDSPVAEIAAQVPSFYRPYHPTPWLGSPLLHTIYAMQFRKVPRFQNEREPVQYPDGGTAIIDWFHPASGPSDPSIPIIVVLHTLGGGSREKCVAGFAIATARRGWRAVVINCRGCGGAKLTSSRVYNALEVDDFHYVIENYIKKRTTSHLFVCGFSMGAVHASTYSSLYNDVTAVVGVSHTMDGPRSMKQLDEFPLKYVCLPKIMEAHHRLLKRNPSLNKPEYLTAKTMTEMDTIYTAPSLGLKSAEEYWHKLSIFDRVPQFRVPTLEIAAEDDPFTKKEYFPFREAVAKENRNMVLVTTAEGGHVGFLQGWAGRKSLIDTLVFDWFDKVSESLNAK
jgi:predicted alpha/beta-fold hydrolase